MKKNSRHELNSSLAPGGTGQGRRRAAGRAEGLQSIDSLCAGLSFFDWKTPNQDEMLSKVGLSANCLRSLEERVEGRNKCMGPGFEFRRCHVPAG